MCCLKEYKYLQLECIDSVTIQDEGDIGGRYVFRRTADTEEQFVNLLGTNFCNQWSH